MEETIVETLTISKIEDIYGKDGFPSGYMTLVKSFEENFGKTSFEELKEKIEGGDEKTLDNLLQMLVIDRELSNNEIDRLSWDSISKRLKNKWSLIEKLFPRIVNSIAGNGKDLHESGDLSFSDYKLEGLLNNAADEILSGGRGMLLDLLLKVTNFGKANLNKLDIIAGLKDEGYAYLYDYDAALVERIINMYITQVMVVIFNNPEVEVTTNNIILKGIA
ncbi:MAG: hypothetical protein Q9M91_07715 [Candidatus Dojkabacteria bacterium]|nr:hypothetical protein [Candidatus Dojkabacteria bacterium]